MDNKPSNLFNKNFIELYNFFHITLDLYQDQYF